MYGPGLRLPAGRTFGSPVRSSPTPGLPDKLPRNKCHPKKCLTYTTGDLWTSGVSGPPHAIEWPHVGNVYSFRPRRYLSH